MFWISSVKFHVEQTQREKDLLTHIAHLICKEYEGLNPKQLCVRFIDSQMMQNVWDFWPFLKKKIYSWDVEMKCFQRIAYLPGKHNKKLNCATCANNILQCLKHEAESLKVGCRKKGFILVS